MIKITQKIVQTLCAKQKNFFRRGLEKHENRKKASRIAQKIPGVARQIIEIVCAKQKDSFRRRLEQNENRKRGTRKPYEGSDNFPINFCTRKETDQIWGQNTHTPRPSILNKILFCIVFSVCQIPSRAGSSAGYPPKNNETTLQKQ